MQDSSNTIQINDVVLKYNNIVQTQLHEDCKEVILDLASICIAQEKRLQDLEKLVYPLKDEFDVLHHTFLVRGKPSQS